jgi:hypothetical protein
MNSGTWVEAGKAVDIKESPRFAHPCIVTTSWPPGKSIPAYKIRAFPLLSGVELPTRFPEDPILLNSLGPHAHGSQPTTVQVRKWGKGASPNHSGCVPWAVSRSQKATRSVADGIPARERGNECQKSKSGSGVSPGEAESVHVVAHSRRVPEAVGGAEVVRKGVVPGAAPKDAGILSN